MINKTNKILRFIKYSLKLVAHINQSSFFFSKMLTYYLGLEAQEGTKAMTFEELRQTPVNITKTSKINNDSLYYRNP